jgi:hypothetical protein
MPRHKSSIKNFLSEENHACIVSARTVEAVNGYELDGLNWVLCASDVPSLSSKATASPPTPANEFDGCESFMLDVSDHVTTARFVLDVQVDEHLAYLLQGCDGVFPVLFNRKNGTTRLVRVAVRDIYKSAMKEQGSKFFSGVYANERVEQPSVYLLLCAQADIIFANEQKDAGKTSEGRIQFVLTDAARNFFRATLLQLVS